MAVGDEFARVVEQIAAWPHADGPARPAVIARAGRACVRNPDIRETMRIVYCDLRCSVVVRPVVSLCLGALEREVAALPR